MASNIYQEALAFHAKEPRGKLGTSLLKPLTGQYDLALAYSPGVAAPCEEISKNPQDIYLYTSKGNMVAVISNGTAVLGLGNLGAAASKPVMEGKVALLKRFAGIDGVDIEVNTEDADEFINAVKFLGDSWGAINLEDIKAPECFIIENKLKEIMDIPVFHDDQHGTAIICTAGILNACEIAGKKLADLKVVVNGAGAAGIACLELLKDLGVKHNNVILCDSRGVVYKGRKEGMNPWKEKHAVETQARTLADAMVGADTFLGLSVKGAVSKDMVKSMAKSPLIFAMANPDPEITPDEVHEVRSDAIVGTGRSDYRNQVNNVMGFPYIFRGALDVQATTINQEMKIAAARAIAGLAKKKIPAEVAAAYPGQDLRYGPGYIIPVPFDPRLIQEVSAAVAKAAMDTGVARKEIENISEYKASLAARLSQSAGMLSTKFRILQNSPKRVIFAEGEEEAIIRTAIDWVNQGYGTPILVGYEDKIKEKLEELNSLDILDKIEISNAANNNDIDTYIDELYQRLQRQGYLLRDCARMIKRDRHTYSAMLLKHGVGDVLITGYTRHFSQCYQDVERVLDKDGLSFGLSMVCSARNQLFYIGDTSVHENPTAEELADIAYHSAMEVRKLGKEPRLAFCSFANFGNRTLNGNDKMRRAMEILAERKVDFEFDGEMQPNIALSNNARDLYPFIKLSGPANILIMPDLNSGNIAKSLLASVGNGTVVGPILYGFNKPVQIIPMNADELQILNMAVMAAVRVEEE
jgi:malate dehydrogenase (oxaloacetate-decarboxylating)(NADP+)